MKQVEPQVFLLARPAINEEGLASYLQAVGSPNWDTDAPSAGEKLIEVAGRSCYRSFEPGLNPNVTKIREGSKAYLENILKVKHGSVVEHANWTFAFFNVSRVFTHEIVRHRAGTAISQESLRFVRLTEIGMWVPPEIRENPEALAIFEEVVRKSADQYSGGKRIGLLARVGDSDHEEYGRRTEQRQERIHGEEVAELYLNYRKSGEQRGKQSNTVAEPGASKKEYQADERGIGHCRHHTSRESQIKHVPVSERRGRHIDPLEHVQGKAAVAEPFRIQCAFICVQKVREIAGRGHIQFADFGENGALIRMEEPAAIPVDPVKPQSEGKRQNDEKHRPHNLGALMPRRL